jgi:hypothetical protein
LKVVNERWEVRHAVTTFNVKQPLSTQSLSYRAHT